MTRAFSTLVGAALAAGLIWVAAQTNRDATGGYWAEIGILAAAGLAIALARLPDVGVRIVPSLPTLAFAFLPALVASAWIVIAAQPDRNTWRNHVLAWSSDIHVTRVVTDLAPYAIVVAFGLGLVFGLVFERRTVVAEAASADEAATVVDTPAPVVERPTAPATTEPTRDGELARR
jgi:hypothetical protein